MTRISVLLIEDNPGDVRLIEELLAEAGEVTFDVHSTDRLSTGRERLESGGIDIVLLDLSLPDGQGLDTFMEFRSRVPAVPVVILTGLDDESIAIKTVQAGAQDYIVKGRMTARSLARALHYALERREMQSRLVSAERQSAFALIATGIAHDFDRILGSIIGFADLLEARDDIPVPAKRYAQTIGKQGRRAAQLVRRLLDYSRQSAAIRRRIQLLPFLGQAVDFFREGVPGNIELALEAAPEVGDLVVEAEPVQLHQVLANLIHNASEAMPDGGEIRCRLYRRTLPPGEEAPVEGMSSGEWIAIAISDTGIGIPPSDIPSIFEPFFSTKPDTEEVGLGLAQAHGIVREHMGFMNVKSAVGKGTTFTVFLPASSGTLPERGPGRDVPEGRASA